MKSYKEKLPAITTLIFDVDGVLTNGDVILLENDVVRILNSRDAYALQYAAKVGMQLFIITGGSSTAVEKRLLNLGVKEVRLNSASKLEVYRDLQKNYGFSDEQVLYMGDDIPDYPVLEVVGVSTCPQDAAVEIKDLVDYQSPYNGGKHCVRDVVEQTLRVQGKWFKEEALTW